MGFGAEPIPAPTPRWHEQPNRKKITMSKSDENYALEGLNPFRGSNFQALRSGLTGDLGWLERYPKWAERYRNALDDPELKIAYTVMYYDTVIAWVVENTIGLPVEVVIPKIFHSNRTGPRQGQCRRYLPFPDKHVTEL